MKDGGNNTMFNKSGVYATKGDIVTISEVHSGGSYTRKGIDTGLSLKGHAIWLDDNYYKVIEQGIINDYKIY